MIFGKNRAGSFLLPIAAKTLASLCALAFLVSCNSAMAAGWVSPTGTTDPQNVWTTRPNAYDDNTSSYASDNSRRTGVGGWIYLTLSAPINCDRIRVNADWWTGAVNRVDVDVLLNGVWVSAISGAIKNAAWTEAAFTAGQVTQARFRYNYTKSGYIFWLYEFDFYEAPAAITAPAVTTVAATSVEETTSILHAAVTDDGGEPCDIRFQYGLTTAYGTNTPWVLGSVTTGDTVGKIITGLVNGNVYNYRVQIRNTNSTTNGANMQFTTAPPGTGWVAPSGSSDASGNWTNISDIHDDELSSYGRHYHNMNDPNGLWSSFIYLSHASMDSDRIRFYAKDDINIDTIDVDVSDGTTWTNVYQGAFNNKVWTEKAFTRQTVTQARVRFRVASNTVGLYWELFEFDFHRVVGVAFSGTYDGVTPLALSVEGTVVDAYTAGGSPYTMNAWVGLGDRILIYYNNNAAGGDGAIATTATGSPMSNLNLAANTLIVRSDGGTTTSNTDLGIAHDGDTDIPYSVAGANITLASGIALSVPAAHSLTWNGNLTLPTSSTIAGTMDIQATGTLSLAAGVTLNLASTSSFTATGGSNLTRTGTGNWTLNLAGNVNLAGTSGAAITTNFGGITLASSGGKAVAASYLKMNNIASSGTYLMITGSDWNLYRFSGFGFQDVAGTGEVSVAINLNTDVLMKSFDSGVGFISGNASDNEILGRVLWNATATMLTQMAAKPVKDGVTVTWSTATEMNNAGFAIYRLRLRGNTPSPRVFPLQGRNSSWQRLNRELIMGAAGSVQPQHYTYKDTTATPGLRYAYVVVDFDLGLNKNAGLPPVTVVVPCKKITAEKRTEAAPLSPAKK